MSDLYGRLIILMKRIIEIECYSNLLLNYEKVLSSPERGTFEMGVDCADQHFMPFKSDIRSKITVL